MRANGRLDTGFCTSAPAEVHTKLARSYCLAVAQKYWKSVRVKTGVSWHMRPYNGAQTPVTPELEAKVCLMANHLIQLEPEYGGYELSIQYMNLLPKDYREKHGIYYTPINVVNTMLEEAKRNGIDLKTARIIDAASGGSAFLAPLCRVMQHDDLSDQALVEDIESRLTGFELDPFAAWLSQFLIDCELAQLAPGSRKPKQIVHHADALTMASRFFGHYDYVIGNPPYGKLRRHDVPHERYHDIISGAPNLYQLFYKLAFLLARENAFVHLITPTGFIGGMYFKALRSYIENHATAISFSFFQHRKNIFDGVQQELVISLFRKRIYTRKTVIHSITVNQKGDLSVSNVGSVRLNKQGPWALPKTREELITAKLFLSRRYMLPSIGYVVHTGYVVLHRSNGCLSNRKGKGSRPMIWSDAIQEDGFQPDIAYSRGRLKWYRSDSSTGLIKEPAVLIKRTSSKEQPRRIHAVLVDQSYIDKHGGFFAENHVNVLKAADDPCVDLGTILRLLKTRIVDQLFRCISGTVTVSSTELCQLPMPSPAALRVFAKNTRNTLDTDQMEHAAHVAYEMQ